MGTGRDSQRWKKASYQDYWREKCKHTAKEIFKEIPVPILEKARPAESAHPGVNRSIGSRELIDPLDPGS